MNEASTDRPQTGVETAKIIYVLYLIGLVAGITAVVGLVMAYINRDTAPDWLKTHYTAQIRTFWIGILYGCIAGILCLILIGFLLLFLLAIWWIVRCVRGLKALDEKTPYPNYESWLL